MENNVMSGIQTAITGMATTVQTNALDTIAAILPILAVVVAALIVARIGFRTVQRYSKG